MREYFAKTIEVVKRIKSFPISFCAQLKGNAESTKSEISYIWGTSLET